MTIPEGFAGMTWDDESDVVVARAMLALKPDQLVEWLEGLDPADLLVTETIVELARRRLKFPKRIDPPSTLRPCTKCLAALERDNGRTPEMGWVLVAASGVTAHVPWFDRDLALRTRETVVCWLGLCGAPREPRRVDRAFPARLST